MFTRFATTLIVVTGLLTVVGSAQVTSASVVSKFERECASCHDSPNAQAPSRSALKQLTPEHVFEVITTGPMAVNATRFSVEEKRAVAELVTGRSFGVSDLIGGSTSRAASAMKNMCAAPLVIRDPWKQPRWNGWSADNTNGWKFQPAEAAGITGEQVPKLKLKWAFAFPGAGSASWAQPTVVGGAVFIGSDNDYVYAIDAHTGCVHWSFEAVGQVRTAITIGDARGRPGVRYAAYFGDYRGNVYSVDAETGKQLWTIRADDHPGAKITGPPVLETTSNRLLVPVSSWEEIPGPALNYECCTFQGSLVALDAGTGKQVWKTYTMPERPHPIGKNSAGTQLYGPSGASIWNAPTIDLKRRAVYVGTGNAYITTPDGGTSDAVMAFDLDTGKKLWWTQLLNTDLQPGGCGNTPAEQRINCPGLIKGPDDDESGQPILVTLGNGRQVLIAGQESGRTTALDPDKRGAKLWVVQAGDSLGAANDGFGGAFDGTQYYKPLPFSDGDGAVAAIQASTGERVWYTVVPKLTTCPDSGNTGRGGRGARVENACHSGIWASASAIPGAVFTGSRNGIMRAFSSTNGRIIWEYPTNRTFETVNGVNGKGGGFGGAAPTIVDGMLFMGSGYAILGGDAGNVLLAFAPE
jgi:polyvinyl alcohol dehydrogenase (cytochrome)